MSIDQTFSIGQVARICNLSVQTLRYYDKIGLVIPAHTDKSSGYRYYSNRDLLYIKIVQDMKQLKLSLDEIGAMLSDSLDSLYLKLELKQKETLEEIKRLEQTVKSIEQRTARIALLQELGNGLKDIDVLVELKRFPERHVISDRGQYACGMEPSIIRFTKLFRKLDASGLTPPFQIMTVYHENLMTFDRAESDLEYCIILDQTRPGTDYTRIIPEGDYITALYCGIPNDVSCKRIYSKLLQWIENNGYIESGAAIERYIVDMAQMMKPEEYIVELQVPVIKALTL